MPTARKRPLQNADLNDKAQEAKQPSMLHRIRNMWQFANLFQFILLFGQALKINDNMDIEDLEAECLKPGSMALQDIGLSLLKFLSSHRGLTHELFDEYARRQFLAKAPDKNPFGTAEVPARFADFDVFTKIRVLQLMTQLIMINPERLREKTEEQRDTDQTNWRIEPYGWDRHDRTYFVLDDNRLYRLTDAPPPPPKPKKNTKKAKAAQRARKRRRVASGEASDVDDAGDEASEAEAAAEPQDDGLGGMKWECLAVSLEEVRGFLSTLQKTKDPNEKTLRDQIQDHLLPILEKQEASRKRKQLQREKELLSLEKMAHAKRSSRIASKMEQRRREEQAREEEQRRREAEAASRKALQQRLKMERERDNRLMSREQRLKERETRRRLHEEELAQLSENSRGERSASARMSERRRLAEIERNKKALQELEEEEDDWIFDCVCGVHGQVDDGTHSVACERCNVWQHSKCLGIDEQEADKDDFHFVCSSCRRREETAIDSAARVIKIKVNRRPQPGSQPTQQGPEPSATASQQHGTRFIDQLQRNESSDALGSTEPLHAVTGPGFHGPSALQSEHSATQEQTTRSSLDSAGITGASPIKQSSASLGNDLSSLPHTSVPAPFTQSANSGAHNSAPGDHTTTLAGDDDGHLGLAATSAASMDALSKSAGSGSGGFPLSKQPGQAPSHVPTKTSVSVPAASSTRPPSLPVGNISNIASSAVVLPHLTPVQPRDIRSDSATGSAPLPPASNGLSPTKHSPPAPKTEGQASGVPNGAATPAGGGCHSSTTVFPPVASLGPCPRPPILTPPVKAAEPARAPSSQQQMQDAQTLKLVPCNSPRLGAPPS